MPLLTGPTSQMGARGPTSPPQAQCRHGATAPRVGSSSFPRTKRTFLWVSHTHFGSRKAQRPRDRKTNFVLKETTHFRGHDGFPVQMYCLRPQGPPPHQPQKCSWTKTQSHLRFEGDTGRAAADANPAGTEPRRPRRSRDLIQQRVWSAPPNHCPKISPHTSTLGLASDCPSPAQGPPEFMQEATGRTPCSRRQRPLPGPQQEVKGPALSWMVVAYRALGVERDRGEPQEGTCEEGWVWLWPRCSSSRNPSSPHPQHQDSETS